MIQQSGVEKAIASLAQLEKMYNLTETSDDYFFPEWFEDLPELDDLEQRFLDRIKKRYIERRKAGYVGQGAVQLMMLSPLLELADLYDFPLKVRGETTIQIFVEEKHEIYRGRVDVLAFQERFWVVVLESEPISFNMDVAIRQALIYMLSNPNPEKPAFAMVTNGSHFMFVKLVRAKLSQYSFSDEFSVYRRDNELYDVLQVMRRIGRAIAQK